MKSLWNYNVERPNFDEINGKNKTDVLIVGGGITGILCAYFLQEAGIDYTLIEANRICNGVSNNTTAKITYEHSLIYAKLIKKIGIDKARLYLEANKKAIAEFKRLAQNIDCDFTHKDSYVYSLNNKEKILAEISALKSLGENVSFCDKSILPINFSAAMVCRQQAQFHPLKFAFSIAEKLNIKENVRALKFTEKSVITDKGTIFANKIIMATHFPLINSHGGYFMKMYQHRSYVIALENAQEVDGMYIDECATGLSFRNHGNLLLLGGNGHRTGKKNDAYKTLENFAKKHYPKSRIKYRWATQDCITLDKIPYIGQYSKYKDNYFVATGFNKWGMTSSMVAAKILTDMCLEKKNKFAQVFLPSRNIFLPQLAVNIKESLIGILTPTTPRCEHLGCALKYNHFEHTWDCPCHGSRFSCDGEVINSPAINNIDIKKTPEK